MVRCLLAALRALRTDSLCLPVHVLVKPQHYNRRQLGAGNFCVALHWAVNGFFSFLRFVHRILLSEAVDHLNLNVLLLQQNSGFVDKSIEGKYSNSRFPTPAYKDVNIICSGKLLTLLTYVLSRFRSAELHLCSISSNELPSSNSGRFF